MKRITYLTSARLLALCFPITVLALFIACDKDSKLSLDETNRMLHQGMDKNDTKQVLAALDQGADIETKDGEGYTPLHKAAWRGNIAMARLLLEHKAMVDSRESFQYTPLHKAARRGHVEMVKLLLDNGAQVDAKTSSGRTPLYEAAWEAHTEVAQLLIDNGADIYSKESSFNKTPIDRAEEMGKKAEAFVKLLTEHGAT